MSRDNRVFVEFNSENHGETIFNPDKVISLWKWSETTPQAYRNRVMDIALSNPDVMHVIYIPETMLKGIMKMVSHLKDRHHSNVIWVSRDANPPVTFRIHPDADRDDGWVITGEWSKKGRQYDEIIKDDPDFFGNEDEPGVPIKSMTFKDGLLTDVETGDENDSQRDPDVTIEWSSVGEDGLPSKPADTTLVKKKD